MKEETQIMVQVGSHYRTLDSIMDDVLAAQRNGLNQEKQFEPQLVKGLIFAVKKASEDRDIKIVSGRKVGVQPTHADVSSWLFTGETEVEEAKLANALAVLGEKTGLKPNHLIHIFPAILRMMKVKSDWSK